jgi:hypothetical protein
VGKLTEGEPGDSSAGTGDSASDAKLARPWRRYLILATLLFLAAAVVLIWWATRPVDTTPPEAVLHAIEPNKPLLAESQQQVTFILRDENDGIPTVFVFEGENQKGTALGINTIRRTPNERGVEIRFEAIRFRRDENDPDRLWVRAVGIANESEGKTPVSLSRLESGEPLDLHFHDEIKVHYVAHVIYEILMTIQYAPQTQQISLSNTTGRIRWKMFGSDAFDEGKLGTLIHGKKGDYAEKPLLDF